MEDNLKQLLLVDLCARLPYGIICKYWAEAYAKECGDYINEDEGKLESISLTNREAVFDFTCVDLDTDIIKPYLRPLSSITEEEIEEIKPLFSKVVNEFGKRVLVVEQNKMALYQDWLNKNMFDYRGLINKGLAIEVTKENNPYETGR